MMIRTLILLFAFGLSSVLLAQQRPIWEQWKLTGTIVDFDVTPNGRFVVALEPHFGPYYWLLIQDRESQVLQKYLAFMEHDRPYIDVENDERLRIVSVRGWQEFDLNARTWGKNFVNEEVRGFYRSTELLFPIRNAHTNVIVFQHKPGTASTARCFDGSTLSLFKIDTLPSPYTYALPGRTRQELVYYDWKRGIGLSAQSIIAPPDGAYYAGLYVVQDDVFAICTYAGQNVQRVYRVDLDNSILLDYLEIAYDGSSVALVNAPLPGKMQLTTNKVSAVLDRMSLSIDHDLPVFSQLPIRRIDSTFFMYEVYGHIHSTADTKTIDDTVLYRGKSVTSITQDHLGRILVAEDTIKVVDHTNGSTRNIDISSGASEQHVANWLIADPVTQTLTITRTGEVRTGDDFTTLLGYLGPIPAGRNDTSFSRTPYISIEIPRQTTTSQIEYRAGVTPRGTLDLTCSWDTASGCDAADIWTRSWYQYTLGEIVGSTLQVRNAPQGRVGCIRDDTSTYQDVMIGVGDVYARFPPSTERLEIYESDGTQISSANLGLYVKPYGASDLTRQILCKETASDMIHLLDLPTLSFVWSVKLPCLPTHALLDRSGKWCYLIGGCGYSAVFDLTTVSVADSQKISTRLFPNPTSDMIEIQGDAFTSWQLYDAVGRLLQQGTQRTITVPVTTGMYYVRVEEGGRWTVLPIAVTR